MHKLHERNKRGLLLSCSFLLPIFIMLFICCRLDVFPFGDRSLAVWDANAQYMDFLAYLKSILTGRSDLFYTFSKTLGGDIIGFFAYYLMSPFHLVVLFLSEAALPLAFAIIYILKISACSLTFQIYLNQRFGARWYSILFSVSYAFIGYNCVYGFNIMWLDAVMTLPLIILGLDRLVSHKKWLLYTLALAYGLITNYYIGFMLCITSVLYYGFSFFLRERERKKSLVVFLLSSLS